MSDMEKLEAVARELTPPNWYFLGIKTNERNPGTFLVSWKRPDDPEEKRYSSVCFTDESSLRHGVRFLVGSNG